MGRKGRRVNILALNAVREALRTELLRLDAIKPTCSNCVHYEIEHCKVYQQKPPGEWFNPPAPIDCESWKFDSLPF